MTLAGSVTARDDSCTEGVVLVDDLGRGLHRVQQAIAPTTSSVATMTPLIDGLVVTLSDVRPQALVETEGGRAPPA